MTSCLNYLELKLARRLLPHERRSLTPSNLELIDFSSNDYLGFSRSPLLKARFLEKLEKMPALGATGSRLLTGNTLLAEQLEARLAEIHGAEAGLLFGSGYLANLALVTALCDRKDTLLYDAAVHASLRDGISLSRARHWHFRHNDVNHLEALLVKTVDKGPVFVIIESLYSTDGSLAPLKEIYDLCSRFGALLIVDEAHATGVFGPGLVQTSLQAPVFARVHTFGKALGVQGAILVGSQELRQFLITTARPFIYTTAPALYQLLAIEVAYELLQETNHTLLDLASYAGSRTPILPLPYLPELPPPEVHGLDVRLLRYPTVARGEEIYRVCLHTFNTKEEIDRLYAWYYRHGN